MGLRQLPCSERGPSGPEAEACCEMKRCFVSPAHRSRGLGSVLVSFIIAEARRMGYKRMYLDSDAAMESALRLYKKHGFREIHAYNDNTNDNPVFMLLDLDI